MIKYCGVSLQKYGIYRHRLAYRGHVAPVASHSAGDFDVGPGLRPFVAGGLEMISSGTAGPTKRKFARESASAGCSSNAHILSGRNTPEEIELPHGTHLENESTLIRDGVCGHHTSVDTV